MNHRHDLVPEPVGHMLALLQLGMCGRCGRARYETRRTARHAARIAAPDTRLRAYRCGTAWHLTSPNGHPQHITAPVTLPPCSARDRVGLDRPRRDERRYPRPDPGESARFQHLVDAPVHRGGPDPLVDARGTDPARPRARREDER
ncbi:hypothetical protein BJF79_33850 [Actinomadura sp. CNU-125]|uniref:hypothetical protein n=1 Tax=Actinomadura sp. CNU-125 TaxID=1904961 RepID=UPI000962E00E|nr:hypothetical protein [Actinomadura sp. CNU-125]OLT34040.1 hypothetical protein BJF79_33850 [Actinomadura sp. CNU-125]